MSTVDIQAAQAALQQAADVLRVTAVAVEQVKALLAPLVNEPTAPAPAPEPPAPAPEPPAPAPGLPPQYLLTDVGSGPTKDRFNNHLQMPWVNFMGDWLDADGLSQGPNSFATVDVPSVGMYTLDVKLLLDRWRQAGIAKGFLFKVTGKASPAITWGGRLSSTPPVIDVIYADGTADTLPVLSSAQWSPSSSSGLVTTSLCKCSTTDNAGISIDIRLLKGAIDSAKLRLTVTNKSSPPAVLSVFELNPPIYVLDGNGAPKEYGVGDNASNPAVLAMPSFASISDLGVTGGAGFDTWSRVGLNTNSPHAVLYDDPMFPGEPVFRGMFQGGLSTEGAKRGSASFAKEFTRADLTNPLFPIGPSDIEEMYFRIYFLMEDDWTTSVDANKLALGWDLRYGWWNPMSGGYWQSTTGNGGAPGTGLKKIVPRRSPGIASPQQYEYEGHSIRMEAGSGPKDPADPYESLRPIQSYVYHLDQPTGFGQMFRHGHAVLRRSRWHCLEQRVRLNSVIGPFDALGNGDAVRDGQLTTWVDGVLADDQSGLAWRRHPDMKIQGPWCNMYFGGKAPSDRDMHYRLAAPVVAREYIGPRRSVAM